MRFQRQAVLEEIGKKGQGMLKKAAAVVVGVGAIGTSAAELLARAGIGNLVLIDNEKVELSNLHRQTLFDEKDIGSFKVDAAERRLKKINSKIKIMIYNKRLSSNNINKMVDYKNIILDCTDNLGTRFLVNEFAVKNKVPWIYAAAIRTRGTVFNVMPGKACLRCFLRNETDIERCEDVGILNTITSIVASIQVTQAIKLILGRDYEKDMIRFDAWNNEFTKIKVRKNQGCPVCSGRYRELSRKNDFTIKLCRTKGNYSVKTSRSLKLDLGKIKKSLSGFEIVRDTPLILMVKNKNAGNIVIHEYGEIVFRDVKEKGAIKELSERILGV